MDDLVVSLCKFTNLLVPLNRDEDFVLEFEDDAKVRMATTGVFNVRSGWKNIVDCILSLNNLGLLPAQLARDAADHLDPFPDQHLVRPPPSSPSKVNASQTVPSRKSSGLMGRFSHFLYLAVEEQLAARQRTLQIVQDFHFDSIFAESKFLQAESLAQLVQALLMAASRSHKLHNSLDDETSAVFCLELLVTLTLHNRDRIMLLWQGIYEHIVNIVQTTIMPGALVEKAVFGLHRICQRLLPYKESLTDELLNWLFARAVEEDTPCHEINWTSCASKHSQR